jgi:hypothetical protein
MLCELRRHQCYLDIYYYKGGPPPRYMAQTSDTPTGGQAEAPKVQTNDEAEYATVSRAEWAHGEVKLCDCGWVLRRNLFRDDQISCANQFCRIFWVKVI